MLRVLTAECDRWNAAKLMVGVAFTLCLLHTILAASVWLGMAQLPNAWPRLNAAPGTHMLQHGLAAVGLALLFGWCERARQARSGRAGEPNRG
ncbi:MAG: hypothetical protein ACKVU4_02965 [Phycisphaerales bacterium]